MSGTSFSGSGFIQLAIGNFSIRNYSRVQFDFRTFHRNGTLFAVKDISNVCVSIFVSFIMPSNMLYWVAQCIVALVPLYKFKLVMVE